MNKTLTILILCGFISACAQRPVDSSAHVDYQIISGQLEKGSSEEQEAYALLFGPEDTQTKYDFYFHWFNVAHEYGHCILDYYGKAIGGVQEEIMVNKFAVSYWKTVGFSDELSKLRAMLEEILSAFPNPVPDDKSFVDWYSEIWGTPQLMTVPVYGYLQFKSVLIAMDEADELFPWFTETGIYGFRKPRKCEAIKYSVGADAAARYLADIRRFFSKSGIRFPVVALELTDSPMIHRSLKVSAKEN